MTFRIADARAAVKAGVEEATAFRRRSTGVFEAPLNDETSLWLNVAVTAGKPRSEPHGADVFIGVRHIQVERIVAEATGESASTAGTYFEPLYSLVGSPRTYVWWPLRAEAIANDVTALVDDIVRVGIPWARRWESLERLADGLRDWYRFDLVWYRLPAVLTLLGRRDEAVAAIEDAIVSQAKSNVEPPTPLQEFGERLLQLVPVPGQG